MISSLLHCDDSDNFAVVDDIIDRDHLGICGQALRIVG